MSVAQAHMVSLRELAATTGGLRASPDDAAEAADAGQSTDPVTIRPPDPVAEGRSGRTGLILILCAVLLAAGVYVLRQRGWFHGDSAPAVTETATRNSVNHDLDPFFAVIPALKRYYEAFGRWPADAEELDRFSRERALSFDLSKFDRLTWEPKVTGGLIIEYRIKGARGARTFHISRPARRQPLEQ